LFPQLSDLINGLFGSDLSFPLSTYKFFLIAAFTAAGIVVYQELARKEMLGEVPGKSSKETLIAMLMAVVFGLLGSKILSALEYLAEFRERPGIGFFIHSGQSFYGGLILASAAIYFYARYKKVPPIHGLDIAAPAIAIGYAVGRLGCHLSGDGCWGIENLAVKPAWLGFLPDWAWACSYPHNALQKGVLIPGCMTGYCHVLPDPVYPTSLYESVFSCLAFILLWSIRKKIKMPGSQIVIFILLNATFRFIIEFIRINPKYNFLGYSLSQAQIVSIFLFLADLAGLFYFLARFQKGKKQASF
jgi:phosphatidylglycerol---prolipoprotein diacylglyceryl transferase